MVYVAISTLRTPLTFSQNLSYHSYVIDSTLRPHHVHVHVCIKAHRAGNKLLLNICGHLQRALEDEEEEEEEEEEERAFFYYAANTT